jgi:uncharacterized protein HemX
MSKEKSAIEVLKQAQHAIKALQRHIQYLERQLEGKGSSASLQERVDTIKFHTNLDFNKTNIILTAIIISALFQLHLFHFLTYLP